MTIAASAFAAVLVFAQVPSQDGELFCSCPLESAFDNDLPMSHPINRCASKQSSDISWSSWFTGHTHGYQFHYLDLLELLSRRSDDTKEKPHTS